MDKQNKEIIGRLFAHGGLAHAKDGTDALRKAHDPQPTIAIIAVKPRALALKSAPGEPEEPEP